MVLHERLKATRNARQMHQKEAARALDVTQSWISKMERGRVVPNVEMLRKLAKLYNVTETYLLGNQPERIPLESERGSAKERVLSDASAQPGLVELAGNSEMAEMLRITDSEWRALHSVKLDCTPMADGYIQILSAIRAACGGCQRDNRVNNSSHKQDRTD